MGKLSLDMAAYERLRSIMEVDYFGKWVVFHDEEFIGSYDDFEDAAVAAVQQFGRGPYLIKRVGEAPHILPASALYG